MNQAKTKKNKVILYEQNLKAADILLYLPDSLKKKLSSKDKEEIKKAFLKAILTYQKKYEEDYLNRMLL